MKIFGIEHILYLLISLIYFTIISILLKKYIKDENKINIMFKIIGLIGLILIILNRIALSIRDNNFILLIPDSYCGMTSLLISISLLFFKKDNYILHALWLIGIIGDLLSIIYPGFISNSPSIFYFPTITSFLHHTYTLFSIILIFIFKYINLDLKKSWVQIIAFIFYIIIGLILVYGFNINEAYYIKEPILKNTPLNIWLLLPIYTIIYLSIMIPLTIYKRNKRNTQ